MNKELAGKNGTYEPLGGTNDSPYNDLKTEYDRNVTYLLADANRWRKITMILSIYVVASLSIWIYVSTLPKQIPWVIEISNWGEARDRGIVGISTAEGEIARPEQAKRYFIEQYMNSLRTWSTDEAVEDRMVRTVKNGSTSKQYGIVVDEWQGDSSPYYRAQRSQVVLTLETMFAVGEKSYQLEWVEKEYAMAGGLMSTKRYRGLMTLHYENPKPEQRETNPLGIYVASFDLSEVETASRSNK